jgi:8-oxo-dGTP diphosphatase
MVKFGIAVKAFIVDDKDMLLIIKREPNEVQMPSIWELPGGRLELGEDPFFGLKRETKEETSIDIDIVEPLTVQHFTRKDGQIITMLIFFCRPLSHDVKLSKEHTDFDWIDLKKGFGKLAEFFHQDARMYINRYMKKVKK